MRYTWAMLSPEHAPPYTRIPEELQELPQWVNWRMDQGSKVPVNPHTLHNAGVNWPKTWSEFGQAREVALERELGLGFVLTEADPYTCVDLDACVGRDMQIDAQIREILDLLQGWVELSPSETGLHVWVRNERPISRRTKEIEVYSYGRWMSVTGRSNPNATLEIPDRTAEVEELCARYLPTPEPPKYSPPPEPVPLSDTEVWDNLFHSDRGDVYQRLYDGDTSASRNDHSLAVILLANQLAWLTDFDAVRMRRLLYATNLVRPKWKERRGDITWIDYQIRDAIAYMSGRQN
jgi:putative DNA primase/helicase